MKSTMDVKNQIAATMHSNQISPIAVLGLAARHSENKGFAGTSRWSAVISACTVAASLDHRTQHMDGPPAEFMKSQILKTVKRTEQKFYIYSDVSHTHSVLPDFFLGEAAFAQTWSQIKRKGRKGATTQKIFRRWEREV